MKRNSYWVLFLCSFVSTIYSQSVGLTRDTTYYDQDWEKTIFLEDAKYARVLKRDQNNQIVGTVKDFYLPTWKIRFEGKLISEKPDVVTGKCTWYYENGKIQSSATYVEGKPTSDLVDYREDGTKVECKETLVEIFPLTQNKIVPYFDAGSSRVVHTVRNGDFSEFIIQYRIQDEGTNSTFNVAKSLMSLYSGNVAGLVSLFSNPSNKVVGTTKNTFLITSSREAAVCFSNNKGRILKDAGYLYSSNNAINETKPISVDKAVKLFYICIQNDNFNTDAISAVEVVATKKVCE